MKFEKIYLFFNQLSHLMPPKKQNILYFFSLNSGKQLAILINS